MKEIVKRALRKIARERTPLDNAPRVADTDLHGEVADRFATMATDPKGWNSHGYNVGDLSRYKNTIAAAYNDLLDAGLAGLDPNDFSNELGYRDAWDANSKLVTDYIQNGASPQFHAMLTSLREAGQEGVAQQIVKLMVKPKVRGYVSGMYKDLPRD